jgi:phospholipid transport system substrate-binding protein
MKSRLKPMAVLAACAVLAAPALSRAAQTDPAAMTVDTFDHTLIDVMKEGPALGAKGRYRKLEPAVQEAFDLPLMTRFAVGPSWNAMSASDRENLIKAFTRLTAASYAHNFDRYGGERFDVSPTVQTRGPDKIVRTKLAPPGRAPVDLIYRMRSGPGGWKIVDVYYGAISQLTTRRSDFAAPLANGGAKGLIAHLEAASDKLMR